MESYFVTSKSHEISSLFLCFKSKNCSVGLEIQLKDKMSPLDTVQFCHSLYGVVSIYTSAHLRASPQAISLQLCAPKVVGV
jgi:hypothetical protein